MENRTRLAIVVIILALLFFGARMGHRNWWLGKIVRDTEQEIVDVGFTLEKLEGPISPQPVASVKIETHEQFIEEAKMIGAETIYFFPHPEGPSFYVGPKRMYLYSYKLRIVPLTTTLFPKYVRPSEKHAVEIARDFLDGEGFKTGKVLSIKLEEKEPNFYWGQSLKSDRPDLTELRKCYVIKFEQKIRLGHFFEVWIDGSEHIVIGGTQCR